MQSRGYPAHSLVELLVVIALIAFIALISGIPGKFLSRTLVRAEVEKLRTVCRYLQRRAMATGTPQRLQFNRTANSYQFNGEKHTLPSGVQFDLPPNAKGPPSSPLKPLTSPITFDNSQIVFQPDGIFQAGAAYLTETKKQYLYALTVGAGAVSYIRTYYYSGRWHPIS